MLTNLDFHLQTGNLAYKTGFSFTKRESWVTKGILGLLFTYLQDMNSKYVYPNAFMSIDDTNKVSQYDTDIKKYAEQKKADWILNGGIEKEWDSYLKKMEKYGLSDYLSIKQKYFDQYQKSVSEEK